MCFRPCVRVSACVKGHKEKTAQRQCMRCSSKAKVYRCYLNLPPRVCVCVCVCVCVAHVRVTWQVSMLRNAAELAVCSALPCHPHLVQLFGYHTEVQLVMTQPPPPPPHATANAPAASEAAATASYAASAAAAAEAERPLALVPSSLVPHLGLPVVQLQPQQQHLQQQLQMQLLQPAVYAALQPQQQHVALVMDYCDGGDLRTAAEAGRLLRAPEPWEEEAAAVAGGGGVWGGRVLDMRVRPS